MGSKYDNTPPDVTELLDRFLGIQMTRKGWN
jgi:hypothetical protein